MVVLLPFSSSTRIGSTVVFDDDDDDDVGRSFTMACDNNSKSSAILFIRRTNFSSPFGDGDDNDDEDDEDTLDTASDVATAAAVVVAAVEIGANCGNKLFRSVKFSRISFNIGSSRPNKEAVVTIIIEDGGGGGDDTKSILLFKFAFYY